MGKKSHAQVCEAGLGRTDAGDIALNGVFGDGKT